jgi:DDE superfamily endonuclease/Helix-turn-helix of DDE superfamily endonuclease
MLRYAQLRSKPHLLQRLTGLPAADFAVLLGRFIPAWDAAERQRLSRPDRRHAIGGGHPYRLQEPADKLLLVLTLCRQGLTYAFAGLLFGLDESNARKLFLRLLPVLQEAADPHLARFLDQALALREQLGGGSVGSWDALLERCPELAEVAIDGTEQPCRRPTDKPRRKAYYSGKKKRHTLKAQLVASATGKVLHVSATYPGKTAEIEIYRGERLPERLPPPTRQFLDLAYHGLNRECPEHDIRLPHKRKSPGCRGKGKKAPELTRGQKQANTLRSKRRVIVENRIAAIKSYRLLAETWRSRASRHHAAFGAVAALTNFRLEQRTAAAAQQAA